MYLTLMTQLSIVKPVLSGHSKIRPNIVFSRLIIAKCRSKVLQNAPREHSAILLTFIKLPFVYKTFVLSIFEWPFKTDLTVILFHEYKLFLKKNNGKTIDESHFDEPKKGRKCHNHTLQTNPWHCKIHGTLIAQNTYSHMTAKGNSSKVSHFH